jgi:hypothetical protein
VPIDANGPAAAVPRLTWYESGLPVEAVHDTVTRDIPAVALTLLGTDGELQDMAETAGVEKTDAQVPAALLALTT